MAILTQTDCLIMGDWDQWAHSGHITAVDATIGRDFVDADRLGDWEPSPGGFAIFLIVGRTAELFRIARIVVAPVNLSVLGS